MAVRHNAPCKRGLHTGIYTQHHPWENIGHQVMQSRFDAIGLSRAQINQIQKFYTTPKYSKKTEIEKFMGKERCCKNPKSDHKEPSRSPNIHMIQERGKIKPKQCFIENLYCSYYSNDENNIYL